jgi:hypothetical protein
MRIRPNGTRVALSVALGLLMVCVGGMATASAAPPAPAASGTVWAYGALRTIDVSGHNLTGGYAYQGSALFGFSAVLNETPTVGNDFSLVIQRTMGVSISIEYCIPNCRAALYSASVSYRAWEATTAVANLTTAANVTEGSTSVPALGLLGETVNLSAGIRESTLYAAGATVLLSRQLWVNESGAAALSLVPALGLIPLTLSSGAVWNATSAFTASGSYAWAYAFIKSGTTVVGGPVRIANSGGGTVGGSGNLTVLGNLTEGATVVLGGTSYDAINLTVEGPFVLREGLVLLPAGANLFSGSASAWSSDQYGAATVSGSRLDVSNHLVSGHLGLAASAAWWRSGTSDPTAEVAGVPTNPAGANDSSAPTYVQAQPESAQQAQTDQQCLATGVGCPASSPGTPRGLFGVLVVAGVVGVAVALVAVGTFSRRRLPPPVYPNASLYPPGTAVTGGPGGGPTPPTPPPTEDDPLGHLW